MMNYKDLFDLPKFIELRNKLKNSDTNNIFKILKLQNYEIRHSSYLAWLLEPKNGNVFLKQLLAKANYNKDNIENIKVYTEYKHKDLKGSIDIFIVGDEFVCVIENKYGSKEHDEQCKRYKEFVETLIKDDKNYKGKKPVFIYLDIFKPDEDLFKEGQALEGYDAVTYQDILGMLKEIDINDPFHKEILEQYKEILNEKYKKLSDEISDLIMALLKEKGALDLILKECKADKNNIDECNTVWTIQDYLWYTAYDKANKYIRECAEKFSKKKDPEGYTNPATGYVVYRFIPNNYTESKYMIAIENRLICKDERIRACIVSKENNVYTVIKGTDKTLVKAKSYISAIINNENIDINKDVNTLIEKYKKFCPELT